DREAGGERERGDGEREDGDADRQAEHEIGEVLAHRREARQRREAGVLGGEICHGESLISHKPPSHVASPPGGVRFASAGDSQGMSTRTLTIALGMALLMFGALASSAAAAAA